MTTDGDKETERNALPAGEQPSPGDVNPETPPETITMAEFQKRQSGYTKQIDALMKERDSVKQTLENTERSLNDLQRRMDEQENERYRDDPEALKTLQRNREAQRENTRLKQELETVTSERDSIKNENQEANFEANCWLSAKQAGITDSFDAFMSECKKLGLPTEEKIAEYAALRPKTQPTQTLHTTDLRGSGGGERRDPKNPSETLNRGFRELKK